MLLLSCLRAPATRLIISIVVVVSVWIVNRRRTRNINDKDSSSARSSSMRGKEGHGQQQNTRQPLPIVVAEKDGGDVSALWKVGSVVWMPPRFAVVPLYCAADGWDRTIADVSMIYDDIRCARRSDQATFAQYLRTCPFLRQADGSPCRMSVVALKDSPLVASNEGSALFTHLAASHDTCMIMSVQQTIVVSLVLRRVIDQVLRDPGVEGKTKDLPSLWETISDPNSGLLQPLQTLLSSLVPCNPSAPPGYGKGFLTASSSLLQLVLRTTCDVGIASLSSTRIDLQDSHTGATSFLTREDVKASTAGGTKSYVEGEASLLGLIHQRAGEGSGTALPSTVFSGVQISLTDVMLGTVPGSPLTASAANALQGKAAFECITYTNDVLGIRFAVHSGGVVREVFLHEDSVVIYYPPCAAAADKQQKEEEGQDAASTGHIQFTIELVASLPSTWEHTAPASQETMTALELLKHNVAFHFTDWTQYGWSSAIVQSSLSGGANSALQVADVNGWTSIYFHESKDGADCRTYVIPIADHAGRTQGLFVVRWECPTSEWAENVSSLRHFMDSLTLSRPSFDES